MRIQHLTDDWLRYLNERLPGERSGLDYWFQTGTSAPGNAVTISGTATWTIGDGLLGGIFASQAGGDVAGRFVTPATMSAPMTLETRGQLMPTNGVSSMGIGFSDGEAGGSSLVSAVQYISLGASSGWRARFGTLNSMYATTNTTVGADNSSTAPAVMPTYMRAIWVSSNSFKVGFRKHGGAWVYSSLTPTITPTRITLFGSTDGSGDQSNIAFDYWRVTYADLSA